MLNNNEIAVLLLNYCGFISIKKQLEIINQIDCLQNLILDPSSIKSELVKLIGEENFLKLEVLLEGKSLKNFLTNLTKLEIGVITIVSDNYPELLKNTTEPPTVLYYRGNVKLLNSNCVAIVGTRRISRYGSDVTKNFSAALAKQGLTIVSGLCDGVDTAAHVSCVEAGGKTIAVLGSGLNEIYPATNTNLAKKIIESGGLIISEYKPNEKPRTFYFPVRNRIIAGLSKAVLITEATLKSGSMHTKNYALEYGREVFAVPGRITDIYSEGCNMIIQNCQTAIALSPKTILDFFGKKFVENKKDIVQLGLLDELILSIIDVNEVHYEEILAKSKVDSKTLNTCLMRLELKGIIKKLSGNFYSK